MFKNISVGVLSLLLIVGGVYSYSSVYGQDTQPAQDQETPQQPPEQQPDPEDPYEQEHPPAQPSQDETNKHCERPAQDGTNPDQGGTDPSKLGCGCVRKCENGKPTENYEEGKRCRVHCKPDNCDCPNPCKS